jgi:hypothetical protein
MPKKHARKFEDIQFQFANLEDAGTHMETVLLRGDEMVIDIQDSDGGTTVYLSVGKLSQNFFDGSNSAGSLMPKVRARWIDFGRTYVGQWIEDRHEYLFSFQLPRSSNR